jgi:hypothetical protein
LSEPIKVFTVAHVPPDLAQSWLQHLRDFDTAHPACRFEVMTDAPNVPLAEIMEMVKVEPALTFTDIFDRMKPAPDDKPMVHVLHYGLPLCRFMRRPPVFWPRNHKWVGADEIADATCPQCIERANAPR